jgi:hypothetical protein
VGLVSGAAAGRSSAMLMRFLRLAKVCARRVGGSRLRRGSLSRADGHCLPAIFSL